jgi:RNA polymerase sigma-70 factor, ECF subfamily
VDAATIQAARNDDRAAQALLLKALQDVWFRFCLSLLHDRDKAADATQETALRFLKTLPAFRGESQIRTWSLGIALNVVREMRRERHFESEDHLTDLAAERSSAGSTPENVSAAEEKHLIRAAMQDLPDRQREVLLLRFFEELSTEETATAMGCAEGTVKATLHQALRALKKKLKINA